MELNHIFSVDQLITTPIEVLAKIEYQHLIVYGRVGKITLLDADDYMAQFMLHGNDYVLPITTNTNTDADVLALKAYEGKGIVARLLDINFQEHTRFKAARLSGLGINWYLSIMGQGWIIRHTKEVLDV